MPLNEMYRNALPVGVLGLGYVGLPLAILSAQKGFQVLGIDHNEDRIKEIKGGNSRLVDVNDDDLSFLLQNNNLSLSSSYEDLARCRAVFICVSTSLTEEGEPDHSLLLSAVEKAANHLEKGSLIIIESTCAPGTTQEIILPLIQSKGFTIGQNLFLAYSPERIDPGNKFYSLDNIPKLVSGITPSCRLAALDLYEKLNIPTVAVKNTTVAELAKVLENTYRDVNVALVNELAIICRECGIDVWQAVRAAASKPFGFQPFYPGPGVGGSCIPKDSNYLIHWAQKNKRPFLLVETARQINKMMPEHALDMVKIFLKKKGLKLEKSRVMVLGVTYKKNVGDLRGSPALELIKLLLSSKVTVSFHDPFFEELEIGNLTHPVMEPTDEVLNQQDCVVLAVSHSYYNMNQLAAFSHKILDLTGTFPENNIKAGRGKKGSLNG